MELIKGLRLKKHNVIILKNDDNSFCLSIFYKNCMYSQYYKGLSINESLDKFISYVKKFQNN